MVLRMIKFQHLPQNNDIREYLGLNLKMLSFIGLEFNLNNDQPIKKSKFMQILPIFMTNIVSLTIAALEITFIAFVLRNHEEHLAVQICSELFSNILCIGKSLRMATAVESIQAAFDEVSILWAKHRPNQHCKMEIMKKARSTLNFSRWYLGFLITGIAGFALPPIHNFVYQYFIRDANNYTLAFSKRIFLLRYPFEINNVPLFFFVLTEEGYILLISAMHWVTCDTLFAQITTHTSIQLKILHYDIGALIDHESVEDRLKAKILIIIRRHQCLLRVCRLIEDIFSPVILTTVLLSALNICVNIFETKAMNAEGNYARAALHANLVLILFLQILFYCSFAETLTDQTSAIAESVYNCKWTEKNHKLGFYLQMIMMKSQSPFYCTAYGFFPIGHARMASIISTSFSYLMMLQSMS
ncbi:hypothetical protein TSAR_009946 [Trichomalopsis sarcophagae]|uniref:Odorant receptor n=1 Tax=Trichomalopsis sarcophagae TaxID=543379 RepID=A0A232F088_9HYME|nr:hypothetical protein TSAR_009946 [Trichomalopsis sarcophagae]